MSSAAHRVNTRQWHHMKYPLPESWMFLNSFVYFLILIFSFSFSTAWGLTTTVEGDVEVEKEAADVSFGRRLGLFLSSKECRALFLAMGGRNG